MRVAALPTSSTPSPPAKFERGTQRSSGYARTGLSRLKAGPIHLHRSLSRKEIPALAGSQQPFALRSATAVIAERLDELVAEGQSIVSDVRAAHDAEYHSEARPDTIPETRYQMWYTEAARVIERVAPERIAEFRALYDPGNGSTASPKSSLEYGIRHYLSDITCRQVNHIGHQVAQFNHSNIVRRKLGYQLAILEATRVPLDSVLADIRGVVQAEFFDSELDAARHLHANRHLRAAGAVAGVVLESHLQSVCASHSVTYQNKKSTIANLLRSLRESGVIDLPVERRIQALADIRNLCSHKDRREPTADEVEQMIDGVDNAIKTVH